MKLEARNSAVRGIVFDLDGTLIDSRLDIAASVNQTLVECGYRALPIDELMSYVGDGAGQLIRRAAGLDETSPQLAPMLERFLEYYTAHAADQTTWMPGAIEALDALGEYPLAVCTNKPKPTTLAVLKALGGLHRFQAIIGGGDVPALKPDPIALRVIAKELGCSAESLVIVGDGPQDIEAGKNAGSFTVGVRGGIAAPERLLATHPDCVLDSLRELPAAIQRLARRH